jgi:uridine kinase
MSTVFPDEPSPNDAPLASALAPMVIRHLGLPRDGRVVVAVAGESGSGKSTTAASLGRALSARGILTGLIHQDDYFLRPPRTNHEYRLLDLHHVGPHEVNVELMHGVEAPAVDYPGNRFVTRPLDFAALQALIVEGTYVFRLRGIDARIFLDATHADTKERRRIRNRDIDAPVIDRILAIEHEIIARQSQQADIIIDRDFAARWR